MVKTKTKQQFTAVYLCRMVLICKGKEKTELEKVNILEHSSHWLLHALWSSFIRVQSKIHQLSAGWLKTNTKHIEIALYLPFGYAHTCRAPTRRHVRSCPHRHKAQGQEQTYAAMKVKCAEVGGVLLSRIWV